MLHIPTISTADELIDRAFRKASRVQIADRERVYRLKKSSIAKLQSVAQMLDSTLTSYVKAFPSFDEMHPFRKELLDILLDLDRLKKSLGALDWARKKILEISGEELREIRHSMDLDFIDRRREAAYGRIASVMKQIKKDLAFLIEARDCIRKLPTIFPESPTVVIAGYPNVGKSMLVSKLSSARPQVAPYPFTTKGIIVGHFTHKWQKYQVIDTPGLLDRPLSERNEIELLAILALRHLADVLVFLIDPTAEAGTSVARQHELLEQVRRDFPMADLLVVETKSDLMKTGNERAISSLTGEGLEELRGLIIEKLRKVKKGDQMPAERPDIGE
jgi:nucleolar GTP-binding protein